MTPLLAPGRRNLFGLNVTVAGLVSVPVRYRKVLPVRHVGIVTDATGSDGWPTILHASDHFGGVVETTASDFIAKRAGPLCYHGRLGTLTSGEMLSRGRAQIGTPYHATRNNCEHFVTRSAGETPQSPQLSAGVTTGTFIASVLSSIIGGVVVAAVASKR